MRRGAFQSSRAAALALLALLALFAAPAGLAASAAKKLASLPLVEVPARGPAIPPRDTRDELAVLLSGDGGWAVTDRGLSRELARGGIPVVGWSSLHYFLTRKTPDRAATDLAVVLRAYLDKWHRERAILIGYSFGADVLPFLVTRLPADLAERVSLIVLLGPSGDADFRFHVSSWLGKTSRDSLPMLPEIERLPETPLLCVYGSREKHSLCPRLPPGRADLIERTGGHVIGKDYRSVAAWILGPRRTSP